VRVFIPNALIVGGCAFWHQHGYSSCGFCFLSHYTHRCSRLVFFSHSLRLCSRHRGCKFRVPKDNSAKHLKIAFGCVTLVFCKLSLTARGFCHDCWWCYCCSSPSRRSRCFERGRHCRLGITLGFNFCPPHRWCRRYFAWGFIDLPRVPCWLWCRLTKSCL
jgi:hypothetical protein